MFHKIAPNALSLVALLCLCCIHSSLIYSQGYTFNTQVISTSEGLPNHFLHSITQDHEGFIWIGSVGGIYRYDGINFKTYDYNFLDIPENIPPQLNIDQQNLIWYFHNTNQGYSGGILDPKKDTTYTVTSITNNQLKLSDIRNMGTMRSQAHKFLILTKKGKVYTYDSTLTSITIPEASTQEELPYNVKEDMDGSLWLFYLHKMEQIKDGRIIKSIPTDHFPVDIAFDHDTLILRTYLPPHYQKLRNNQLEVYLTNQDTLPYYLLQITPDYICYIKNNHVFVSNQTDTIYQYNLSPLLNGVVDINNVFIDPHNNIWAASDEGIIKITIKKNPFQILFPSNSTRGIFKDSNTLWMGGYRGSFQKNLTTHSTQQFLMLPNVAFSFLKMTNGNILIAGKVSQLLEYIPSEEQFISYHIATPKYPYNQILFIHQNTITKHYWIGSEYRIFIWNKEKKQPTPISSIPHTRKTIFRQIYQNKEGIWIASNQGLFLLDPQTTALLKHYTKSDGLPSQNINYIYEDREGIFWLGTRNSGLVAWDRQKNTFGHYTMQEGLSNNNIYAVYEDEFNHLWLPSDYGLIAFDKQSHLTKTYLSKNGIAQDEFNTYSHFQDADGYLYFGGIKGITQFHPKDVHQLGTIDPPLYITQIQTLPKDGQDFVDQTDYYTKQKKILFTPNDNILKVNLALLDYENSAKNQYAYTIDKKQEQWIYTQDPKISIINPPYGEYDLVIKARSSSGSWSNSRLVVPLIVQKPFYLQWWFFLFVGLTLAVAIFIIIQWRIQKLQKDQERLEGEVKKRTHTIAQQAEALKELDKTKTRFFANITHEFRTPLTLITGPLEQMIASPPPRDLLKDKLSLVLKNAQGLLGLINQLLDISKLENYKMKVEVAHGDIVAYTDSLVKLFLPMAKQNNIRLDFVCSQSVFKTHFDKDKWHKIVHNLVSNALKFTDQRGKVDVTLKCFDETKLELIVTDTGIGISEAALPHIFNRFYQVDATTTRQQEGTGIGLALVKELIELQEGTIAVRSTLGQGSTFTVQIPLNLNAITTNQQQSTTRTPTTLSNIAAPLIITPTTSTTNTQGKLELLIIEDNVDMRAYIRSCIDESIYHITEAQNGEEGITKAQEIVPDVIISDVMMPKKDGFEVTQAIRAHISTSHIPLILLTAKASLESKLEGIGRGADAYLTKPFNPQELVLRIHKLIELRRELQQRYLKGTDDLEHHATFQKEDAFITELRQYIQDNLSSSDLNVQAISKYFGISRTQVYRKMEALINIPIGQYIRSIRLETAIALLKTDNLNMTEIAYETGFSSLSHFSKTFKKAYGKSPSEWKN